MAPVSAVSGSRPSAAAVTTLSARRPIHAPLPSSPHTGPQPPQRAVVPVGPRPNATEPVPLMSSTPGPSPNASSSAMLKSGWITISVGEIAADERLPERLTLRLAPGAGDADAEHARRDVRHLARRERVAHDGGDHVRRLLGLARAARRSPGPTTSPSVRAVLVGDDGARLRAAAVDSNDDEGHARCRRARPGHGCVQRRQDADEQV